VNRYRYYLAAILAHLLVLVMFTPAARPAFPAPVEKQYVEVSLSAKPAAQAPARFTLPAPDSPGGALDDPGEPGSPAAGPPVDDSPPPVAEISPDVNPPPPSPVEPDPAAPFSFAPPTLPTPAPESLAQPVGLPTINVNRPPDAGNGLGPSSAPFSGSGGAGNGRGGRGGQGSGYVPITGLAHWLTDSGGNGHFYEAVFVAEGITWDEAQAAALARGGYLVTLTSAEENNFVFRLVQDPKFWLVLSPNRISGPWLGGHKVGGSRSISGLWQWENNEGTFEFTCWAGDEPDNSGGVQDKLCYYTFPGPNFRPTWDDQSGKIKHSGYIVEWDEQSPGI